MEDQLENVEILLFIEFLLAWEKITHANKAAMSTEVGMGQNSRLGARDNGTRMFWKQKAPFSDLSSVSSISCNRDLIVLDGPGIPLFCTPETLGEELLQFLDNIAPPHTWDHRQSCMSKLCWTLESRNHAPEGRRTRVMAGHQLPRHP